LSVESQSSCGAVLPVLDYHRSEPKSHMSCQWHPEEHPTNVAYVHVKIPNLYMGMYEHS